MTSAHFVGSWCIERATQEFGEPGSVEAYRAHLADGRQPTVIPR
jgi:hypothetical protein